MLQAIGARVLNNDQIEELESLYYSFLRRMLRWNISMMKSKFEIYKICKVLSFRALYYQAVLRYASIIYDRFKGIKDSVTDELIKVPKYWDLTTIIFLDQLTYMNDEDYTKLKEYSNNNNLIEFCNFKQRLDYSRIKRPCVLTDCSLIQMVAKSIDEVGLNSIYPREKNLNRFNSVTLYNAEKVFKEIMPTYSEINNAVSNYNINMINESIKKSKEKDLMDPLRKERAKIAIEEARKKKKQENKNKNKKVNSKKNVMSEEEKQKKKLEKDLKREEKKRRDLESEREEMEEKLEDKKKRQRNERSLRAAARALANP